MAGKGAPDGNQYAKKERRGKSISLFLRSQDMELLRLILSQRGKDSSDKACVRLAKDAAKMGINRLVIDKAEEVVYWNSETAEKRKVLNMKKTIDNRVDLITFLNGLPNGATSDVLANDLDAGNFDTAHFEYPNGTTLDLTYTGPVASDYLSPFEGGN